MNSTKTNSVKTKCKTQMINGVLHDDTATNLYEYLLNVIEWEDGVKSRSGFTRKAKALNVGDDECIDSVIATVLPKFNKGYIVMGIYLNYYADGTHYTPNHSHKGTHQLVISLGATRILTIGKKEYYMNNGDAILFGTSIHGVPKDETVTEGRISIATFMLPI